MDLKHIVQADVYDREDRLRGLVDMFSIEGRKLTIIEHKTLGQVGVLALGSRPVEAIKGKIKIGHLDEGLDREISHPGKTHDWQMHQKVDVSDADGYSITKSHTLVWHAKWRFLGDNGMDTQLGEKAEIEYDISIPALKIYRLGDERALWELDVWNDVYEINGQRVWAE